MGGDKSENLKKLEKIFDTIIEKAEEAEGKIIVYIPKEKLGRAIGPKGSVVKAAELVIGKQIELRQLE